MRRTVPSSPISSYSWGDNHTSRQQGESQKVNKEESQWAPTHTLFPPNYIVQSSTMPPPLFLLGENKNNFSHLLSLVQIRSDWRSAWMFPGNCKTTSVAVASYFVKLLHLQTSKLLRIRSWVWAPHICPGLWGTPVLCLLLFFPTTSSHHHSPRENMEQTGCEFGSFKKPLQPGAVAHTFNL